MFGFRKRRRARIAARPFPAEWLEIVERNFPFARLLNEGERAELHRHIQIFLDEKCFEGCAGLEITDEIRLTVAAHACLLLLNRPTDYYPQMVSVLVYPRDYHVYEPRRRPDGIVVEGESGREGESWHRGPVVLSWESIRREIISPWAGRNVIIHEFAHQLDGEFGTTDGAPTLARGEMYGEWARVLGAEYERLRDEIERGRRHFIDDYAATNPAEFFAVVTETFFSRSSQLRRYHPELYAQFATFYHLDPATHRASEEAL